MRRLFSPVVLLAVFLLCAAPLHGQNQLPAPPEKGTVVEVLPNGVKLSDSAGHLYLLQIGFNCKVQVTGTAEANYLSRGTWVKFMAALTKAGAVEGDIDELSIVSLSDEVRPGALPDLKPGEELKDREKKGPVDYQIVGQVMKIKNGQFEVTADDRKVLAKLSEKAKIIVDSTDYSLAREGDLLTNIKGKTLTAAVGTGELAVPGIVEGHEVAIELATPLAAPSKAKKKSVARGKTAKARPVKKKGKKKAADDEPLFNE